VQINRRLQRHAEPGRGRDRRARLEGHRQADFLAEGRVRQPDDGGLGDRGRGRDMRRILDSGDATAR
jgi:hypothetical protein